MAKAPAQPKAARPPEPEPGAFEATCPTCGMTADVGAAAEHVRCRRCGTVIRLVDHPVPAAAPPRQAAAPPAGASKPVAARQPGLAMAVGLAAPFGVLLLLGVGDRALDQPAPDTGAASLGFLLAALAGAGTVLLPRLLLEPGHAKAAWWGAAAAVPAAWYALAAARTYEDGGLAWILLGAPFFVVYLVVMAILGGIHSGKAEGGGGLTLLAGGVGLCVGFAAAAVLQLLDLERQAALAREAHETPAWGLLLVAGTLLAMAAWRRRAA